MSPSEREALVYSEARASNTALAELFPKWEQVAEKAETLVIEDRSSFSFAVESVAIIAKLEKLIDGSRAAMVKPLNDQVRSINDRYKDVLGKFSYIHTQLKQKMSAYLYKEEQRERAAQAALEATKIRAEAQPLDIPDEILGEAPIAKTERSVSGSVTQRKVWKWDVVNRDLVPEMYWMLNDKMINDAVRDGAREIPGLRIFQDTLLVTR